MTIFLPILLINLFKGSREHYLCDTEVNLCYSTPCQNNGTCKIRERGYTCICPTGFAGE